MSRFRPHAHTDDEVPPPILHGLVLAGGRSSRMGLNKPDLKFHGLPQARICVELLSSVCRPVFISLRSDQRINVERWGATAIVDLFEESGPMSGILSAFELHPDAAWLLLACDMPFVTRETLQDLVGSRDLNGYVTAFVTSEGAPEPLLAIYEPRCLEALRGCMSRNQKSLRKAIQRWGFHGVEAKRPGELSNINTPEELRAAMERLARQNHS